MKFIKKNNNKQMGPFFYIVLVLSLTLLLSLISGSILAKVLLKDSNVKTKSIEENNSQDVSSDNNTGNTYTYIAIQGGLFKEPENADKIIVMLSKYGEPFISKEEDNNRVLLGIFTEENYNSLKTILDEEKIANSKMTFEIANDNICNQEISEIVDAYLQILNKASEEEIEAIKTDEFKAWVSSLEKVDDDFEYYSILEELKDNCSNLKETINKEEVSSYYLELYKISLNFKNK
ncbi:MAG: hypothetical protein ACERKV_11925 [Clostridiaceae bacterium]